MTTLAQLKSSLEVLSSISIIAVSGVVAWGYLARPPVVGPTAGGAEGIEERVIQSGKITNRLGEARTILVEFADFQCPFCAQHTKDTFPRIERELVGQGLVSYAFVNFPLEGLHPQALKASEAAECAGRQGRYWEMRARLFSNQHSLSASDLLRYGQAENLDLPKFEKCLAAGETTSKVLADVEEGEKLGVTATPSFFVGIVGDDGAIKVTKRLNGAARYDAFRQAVDDVSEASQSSLSLWRWLRP